MKVLMTKGTLSKIRDEKDTQELLARGFVVVGPCDKDGKLIESVKVRKHGK